jgi:hypothetical protein
MALQRLAEFYPNYQEEIFAGDDIKGFDVYAGDSDEKVGTVYDALVDDTGRFRCPSARPASTTELIGSTQQAFAAKLKQNNCRLTMN